MCVCVCRFVAACGFTPDVKVWEVCFAKTGEFKEVTRAFDLKGHSAGVYSFDFSNDSRRSLSLTHTDKTIHYTVQQCTSKTTNTAQHITHSLYTLTHPT